MRRVYNFDHIRIVGNRVGLKAVVLEQSDRLRSEGTTITLWTNAMRVLDVFEMAEKFRRAYINLQS